MTRIKELDDVLKSDMRRIEEVLGCLRRDFDLGHYDEVKECAGYIKRRCISIEDNCTDFEGSDS